MLNSFSAFSASVTLSWGPSSDPEVVGYKIYYGASSGNYTNVVDAGGNTSATINGLVEGVTYYFAATAYNILGLESDFSNETSYTIPLPVVNQPPTLNALGNLTIAESAAQQTVNLAGISAGASESGQTITITASSSNTGLIPNPSVTYTSPNATGSLRFTPVAFQSGSATITVTVNDNMPSNNITTRTFTVTVFPVNNPPTLNALNNLSINQGAGQQTVSLSGISTGATNETQTLAVTASSSNTGLIPNPTVTYSSPNSTGSIRFTPVANASGSATVTVTVNDGGASNNVVSRTFTVTVNGAPTISAIADQTIATNSSAGPIAFTVGDPETSAGNLTLSSSSSAAALIPVSNIVFGGTGANRTVTLTPLPAQSGTATIVVTVSDGNLTASRLFLLKVLTNPTPPGQLTVVTNGAGAVTLSASKSSMIVGKTYTATAVPSTGQIFTGWSGSVNSKSPKISFVMNSNMVLQANFMANPFIPIAGTFNGLFYEQGGVQTYSAGSFSATITTKGTYTGRLQIGSRRCTIKGQLSPDCRATNTVLQAGFPSLTVEISAGTNNPADRMTGRVTDGGWQSDLVADRAVFNVKTSPAPLAGSYTMMVSCQSSDPSLPAGDGYGTLRVDGSGRVKFVGTLGDGTKVSQGGTISKDGAWPFFVPLYAGRGLALSWLAFENQASSDFNGSLIWIKPSNPLAKFYSAGFTNECLAAGSTYVAPPAGENVLAFDSGLVSFSNGNLAADFSSAITLGPASHVTDLSGHGLVMSFSLTQGTFKGKVVDPSSGETLTFGGVAFQKMSYGFGSLLGTDQSSLVTIQP